MIPAKKSRAAILAAIRSVRLPVTERPNVRDVIRGFPVATEDPVERFIRVVRESGAVVVDSETVIQDGIVFDSRLGVAETGAVWLSDDEIPDRGALFLAEHVIVRIPRSAIVQSLHDAYAQVALGEHAFGVFMAGPSKTADIEQSLVIGAHGPRGLTVMLTE